MKYRLPWIAGLLGLSLLPSLPAQAATYFGFSIGTTNAPPPRFYYRQEPALYVVPNTGVYVAEDVYGDMDMFRYGAFWYVYNDGYWYRSPSYRGPFRAVDVRYVPTQIFYVPSNHWRHYPNFLAQQPRWRYRYDRANWNNSGYDRDWRNSNVNWRDRNNDQWRGDQNDQWRGNQNDQWRRDQGQNDQRQNDQRPQDQTDQGNRGQGHNRNGQHDRGHHRGQDNHGD